MTGPAPDLRCNLCGGTEFYDFKSRKAARCASCKSFERTRLLGLFLQRVELTRDTRVLHLSPEEGLYSYIKERVAPENYVTADIDTRRYSFAENIQFIDLCEMEDWPSDNFDLILHSHVLEHTPCNIAYSLFHLHRILKPGGLHLCIIPFLKGYWDETFQEIGEEARHERFGQHDHVRRYGRKDMGAHLGKIIRLPDRYDARDWVSEDELRRCNVPEMTWAGFTPSTVLQLRKEDYLLTTA
ncbi:MAG: methyltransferase domain-containing protein [Pseudomonadota bacterium]